MVQLARGRIQQKQLCGSWLEGVSSSSSCVAARLVGVAFFIMKIMFSLAALFTLIAASWVLVETEDRINENW